MNNDEIFQKKIDVFTRLETSTFFILFFKFSIFFIIVSERLKTSIFFRKISRYSSLFVVIRRYSASINEAI